MPNLVKSELLTDLLELYLSMNLTTLFCVTCIFFFFFFFFENIWTNCYTTMDVHSQSDTVSGNCIMFSAWKMSKKKPCRYKNLSRALIFLITSFAIASPDNSWSRKVQRMLNDFWLFMVWPLHVIEKLFTFFSVLFDLKILIQSCLNVGAICFPLTTYSRTQAPDPAFQKSPAGPYVSRV